MERTLVILKPDAVERRLVGDLIRRFEQKGLRIVGLKLQKLPRATVAAHYAEHREKAFFSSLVDFMTSGPVVLMALEGPRAIEVVRRLMGKTKGYESEAGTIRGDLGISAQFNLVHGSDSPASAHRELDLFFRPAELEEYALPDEKWFQS
jgi:nucleoside-diphosphate kinase